MTDQLSGLMGPSGRVLKPTAAEDGPTLFEYAAYRLQSLFQGARFGEDSDEKVNQFLELMSPWGDLPLLVSSRWRSEVSDDNTPVELSVALSNDVAEVRALIEAPSTEMTLAGHRRSALILLKRMEQMFGADLTRFYQLSDLFMPEDMVGVFAAWISVVFRHQGPPLFKVYLNPQARGVGRAHMLVEQAMTRLGLSYTGLETALSRGPLLDELKYFALDLTPGEEARMKMYVHHHHAGAAELEKAASNSRNYNPGEVHDFIVAVTGRTDSLEARAPFTCHAFSGGLGERATATTVYAPVCAYAPDDAVVRERVIAYLVRNGQDPQLYESILRSYADRPLAIGTGLQSWAALRAQGSQKRVTIYLAIEAQQVFPPHSIPAPTASRARYATAADVVARLAVLSFEHHPMLNRDLHYATAELLSNLHEAIVRHLPTWRDALLAALPAEERGKLQAALCALVGPKLPDQPFHIGEFDTTPGQCLYRGLRVHCEPEHWAEALGAVMMTSIGLWQISETALSAAKQRPPDWPTDVPSRTDLAIEIARSLSSDQDIVTALFNGAYTSHVKIWAFLTALYARYENQRSSEPRPHVNLL